MTALLKTGHMLDYFQMLGSYFVFRNQQNDSVKFGDISVFVFLRTTSGILSGSVAFGFTRILLIILIPCFEMMILLRLSSARRG